MLLNKRVNNLENKHIAKKSIKNLLVFYCNDEDENEAIKKACKDKNITLNDVDSILLFHGISPEYANRQKAPGN